MPSVIDQLQEEHINVTRLLNLLEREINAIRGGKANYEIMQDVMHYMTHYPDLFHHPKEDLVFQHLMQRDRNIRDVLEQLLSEHQDLIDSGRTFLEALSQIDGDIKGLEADIEESGRHYVEDLRRHMAIEEGKIFPLVRLMLTERDWAAIDEEMGQFEDPLFGRAIGDEYRRLFELIVTSENDTDDAATPAG